MISIDIAVSELEYFGKDVRRCYSSNWVVLPIRVLLNPALLAVFFYRVSRFFYFLGLSPVSKLLFINARVFFGVELNYRAKIGPGFLLAHGVGTVVGGDVIIGDNVMIAQGVTLGNNFSRIRVIDSKERTQPTIGNECFILAGAKVVGPVLIADRTIVGANAVVTKDTLPDSIYAGIPAKRIGENRRRSYQVGAGVYDG